MSPSLIGVMAVGILWCFGKDNASSTTPEEKSNKERLNCSMVSRAATLSVNEQRKAGTIARARLFLSMNRETLRERVMCAYR